VLDVEVVAKLQVGQIDRVDVLMENLSPEADHAKALGRVQNLPGPFHDANIWLTFWLEKLNSRTPDPKWHLTATEALALMGSHTLIDNQGCATTGASDPTKFANINSLGDRQCGGGKQRMFTWDNSYFKVHFSAAYKVGLSRYCRTIFKFFTALVIL
jgi:hypothetical protein